MEILIVIACVIVLKGAYHAQIYVRGGKRVYTGVGKWTEQHFLSYVSDAIMYGWAFFSGIDVRLIFGVSVLTYGLFFQSLVWMGMGEPWWKPFHQVFGIKGRIWNSRLLWVSLAMASIAWCLT